MISLSQHKDWKQTELQKWQVVILLRDSGTGTVHWEIVTVKAQRSKQTRFPICGLIPLKKTDVDVSDLRKHPEHVIYKGNLESQNIDLCVRRYWTIKQKKYWSIEGWEMFTAGEQGVKYITFQLRRYRNIWWACISFSHITAGGRWCAEDLLSNVNALSYINSWLIKPFTPVMLFMPSVCLSVEGCSVIKSCFF